MTMSMADAMPGELDTLMLDCMNVQIRKSLVHMHRVPCA